VLSSLSWCMSWLHLLIWDPRWMAKSCQCKIKCKTNSGCSQLTVDQLTNADRYAVPLLTSIQEAYAQDAAFAQFAPWHGYAHAHGLCWLENRVVIPNCAALRKRIIHDHHDVPRAGHKGITRTLELVARVYWWRSIVIVITIQDSNSSRLLPAAAASAIFMHLCTNSATP
jgi:hypothetical protein